MDPAFPPEILRLATSNPALARLSAPMGSAEKRSPICGSRILVELDLDDEGRVSALGMKVQACAFSQAAATVFAEHAAGRAAQDLVAARDAFAAWIAGEGPVPDWPGLALFAPERLNTVRKASVQLAFQAGAEAATQARAHVPIDTAA